MKNGLLFFSIFCFSLQAIAQQVCPVEGNLHSTDPTARAASQNYEATLQNWIQQHPNSTATTITIPVVVHVIWKTAIQNISDPQVLSQIDALNEDFGRTNADAVNTPSGFQSVAANTGIQFCLAQVDPNGNPTNGIERVQTATTSFSNITDAQHSGTGGVDAWDPSRYFNIWVCNLAGPVGSGEFPTATLSQTYGVVVRYDYFGRTGTVNPPYIKGRICTHMVGHSLNLYHLTENPSCTDSDFVTDTPVPSQLFGSSCQTYPLLDACNPVAPGVMYMNYMVSFGFEDSCINMFTIGQAARMNAVLYTPPYNSLATSTACIPSGINTYASLSDPISISPNPSQDVFNINLNGVPAEKIILYDMLGNKMEEFSTRTNSNAIMIDLSYEANGVYFLQVVTAENLVINKKIILSN